MNSFMCYLKSSYLVQQITQWPPTSTTVIGGGLLVGWVIYHFTGSFSDAVFVAGVFKAICPQASDATDKALELVQTIPGIKK